MFDALLNFEPTESLSKRSDVAEIGRFRDCSSGRVENELVQKNRVAVTEF